MKLTSAAVAGVALFGLSLLLLWAADEAMDAAAIAGGTGVVISGALIGLTYLSWRWRGTGGAQPYLVTTIEADDSSSSVEAIEAALRAEDDLEDAAAV